MALVAVVALTLVHARVWGASAAARSQAVAYTDPVGDAGDAPDIVEISIVPVAGGVVVEIKLASATELGPYGWVLMGLDTDRNRSTGAPRGNEFLVLANGDRVVLTRWDGRHLLAFPHRPLRAVDPEFGGAHPAAAGRGPRTGGRCVHLRTGGREYTRSRSSAVIAAN